VILNLEFVKVATAVFTLLTGHLELSELSFNNSNEIIFSSSWFSICILSKWLLKVYFCQPGNWNSQLTLSQGSKNTVLSTFNPPYKASILQIEIWSTRNKWS